MNTKIFIGTPCYGGMITANYFESCLKLTALAATKKIELQFGTIGNDFAGFAMILQDAKCTSEVITYRIA